MQHAINCPQDMGDHKLDSGVYMAALHPMAFSQASRIQRDRDALQ